MYAYTKTVLIREIRAYKKRGCIILTHPPKSFSKTPSSFTENALSF